MLRTLVRVAFVAALIVPLAACGKQEAAAPAAVVPDLPLDSIAEAKEAVYRKHLDDGTRSLAAGDTGAAIAHLKQAIGEKADGADAYFQLGRVYVAKKDDAEALKAFTEAIRLNPEHTDAYLMERAALHTRAGRLDDASYDYRQVIARERDPKTTARAYWLRSEIADREGNRADFRYDRDKAMTLDPAYKKQVTAGDVLIFNHTGKPLTFTFSRMVTPDGTVRTFPPGFKCTVADDSRSFLLDGAQFLSARSIRFSVATDHGSKTFEQVYQKGTTLEIHIAAADLSDGP